ncbi:MAG: right-handed parallel beta-helix repeat-containing protein, partial [Bacteroidia bacterium]|nr:right-handed parallel beta-helix repeat-containing protein [Bacteroidia bacterium]
KAVALARSSSSNPTYYLAASNNNLFYAGTPGPSNLIFTDYTNSHSDLALYKTFMANRDQSSFTENILFESTDIASSDYLRPKVGVLSNAESTGGNLGVLDDLNDVNIRVFPQSGQVYDGGTAPDIGAVEFDGISTLPTGTKTVGTGKDFTTIQAAIAYINSYGGAGRGGITFEVDPGHTETFSSPTAGLITASGSSASTITFKKAAGVGANPLITSGVGTGSYDGIIIIYGGDYITFDGIDVKDNTANINVTTQMEWGYALLKTSATDGVKNTTIKNCTITLQYANTSTRGIYMDNRNTSGGSFTITSTAGIHEKNLFQSNTINTAYTGIYIYGYSTLAYYDNDNTLDGNTIDNFKNYGIYCYYNSTDSIINNTIKNGTFTTTRYGLYKYNGTNSVLSGNVIKDISNTSGSLYGLYISTATNVIVRSNTIKSLSGVSAVYGMYYTSCTAPLIEKNKISTITTTYNSTIVSNGIYLTGGTSAVLNNNAVAKIYAPSANTSSTTYCHVNGIYIQGHAELNHNTVYLDCPTGGGANFSSCAIYLYTLSAYNLLMRNNIFVNASTYASGTHIAFKRYNSSYWNNYNAASNNNLYYAGTPGVKNLICYASTTYQTLAAYMADASVSPKDSRASTENVAFASTNIDDVNFLQPNAATANTIESGGTVISGFSDDIYTPNSRATYPKTGQVNGGGWAPDLGAVEYDGTPAPGLGGNITVGTGKDYTTIAAAIADLNLNGVSNGEVVFLVDPGHTETFATPTAGVINATGGGNHFITFKKATGPGANPLITAAAGTGSLDGIIVINGGDYITFDGIDVQENSANTNATTQMEWGYAILKASATNAPKNVTIKNCSVTLNNSNTASCGIYINNHTTASNVQLTISNTTGRTDDVTLLNNTITNAFTGIYSYGSSISTYYNLRTTIQGNTISTFGSDGVYSNYENTLLVSGNTIKNGAHTGVMSGVNINNGTAPITIEKNRISDLSSSNSGLNSVVGINVNTLTTASKIMNNMVSNLAASVSTDENSVAGIYVNGVAEVYYNTVYLNCTSGGVGFGSNAIYANTDNNLTQRNNIFINASTTGKVVSYRRSSTT